ncbi:hypothetical protein MJG53_020685, partial [Ovis ammon polii x Ovis aries]
MGAGAHSSVSHCGPPGPQAPSPAADTFLHYRTSKVRALRAARLERLVRELVSGDPEQDPGFVPAFLATHRAFVPTDRVLGLLLPPPAPPLPPGGQRSDLKCRSSRVWNCGMGSEVPPLLARAVVSVLGSWLRDHPQDFWDPPAHSDLGSVCSFLGWAAPSGAEAREAEKLLGDFLKEAEAEQEEEEQSQTQAGERTGGYQSRPARAGAGIGDGYRVGEGGGVGGDPSELRFHPPPPPAQELFSRLRPFECLGSVWSQRDRPGAASIAPTVRATVTQFNTVTGCVLGSVLGEPGLAAPQRAQRLEKWIRIAQRCRELRNFSSLRAILSALQSNPIYRLKRSWGAVSREPLSTFRKLAQIFSDENNHLSSREILSQVRLWGPQKLPPGPIPYLGTFLTDLVMLDTALPDMLKHGQRSQRPPPQEWEILARIQQLQRRCQSYCLSPRPPILAALRAQHKLSEEQSYHISRVIEPPASSCPSSPRIRRQISLTKRLRAGTLMLSLLSTQPRSPQLPLSPDLPGPWPLALPLSGPHISLPGQQGSEARVIRVSIDNDHGNLYRSILLTSQDKAPSVVQRALEKHNVAQPLVRDYQLFQVLPGDRELLIPDNANVFYAMSPAAPGDFVLRRKEGAQHTTSV